MWAAGVLKSSSMSLKHVCFEILIDMLQILKDLFIQSFLTTTTNEPYQSSIITTLEHCLDIIPLSRLEVMASRRLWYEMEDDPSYSRYLQILLHFLSESKLTIEFINNYKQKIVVSQGIDATDMNIVSDPLIRQISYTETDIKEEKRSFLTFNQPNSYINLTPQKEIQGSWTLEMWIRRTEGSTTNSTTTPAVTTSSTTSAVGSSIISSASTESMTTNVSCGNETSEITVKTPMVLLSSSSSSIKLQTGKSVLEIIIVVEF